MSLKRSYKIAVIIMAFIVMLSLPLSSYASEIQRTNAESYEEITEYQTLSESGSGGIGYSDDAAEGVVYSDGNSAGIVVSEDEIAETAPAEAETGGSGPDGSGTDGGSEENMNTPDGDKEGAEGADPYETFTENGTEGIASPEDGAGDIALPEVGGEDADSPEDDTNTPGQSENNISEDVYACGENAFWTLDENGTLTISGSGYMYTYTDVKDTPWYRKRSSIRKIVIKEGILNVGSHSFIYCKSLEFVEIPLSVKTIESSVFSADIIKKVTYPGTKPQWDRISIARSGNSRLFEAELECRITGLEQAKAVLSKTSYVYSGKEITPDEKVVCDGSVLKRGTDYTISFKQNKNAGTAKAVVKGKGYYSGSLEFQFRITPAPLGSVTHKYSSMKYTGKARTQTKGVSVKAKVNGKTTKLRYGRDYAVSYKNNVKAGKASLIVKGKGNFKGTIKKTFKITKLPLKTAKLKYKTIKYTGKARTQTKTTKVYAVINGKKKKLTLGRDYSISYRNNYYGKATMIIKGKGNFKGTIKKYFNITIPWGNNKTSTKSVYKSAFERLINNIPINRKDPYGIVFTEFSSKITGSSVIPGIKNTHIIDRSGSHILCHEMVMQGMCTSGDYTLISAYCHDKIHSSVIYVMKNGKYVETIVLTRKNGEPFINHVGGLTLMDGNVYIAGSKDDCIYYIPFHTIESRLARQDARKIVVRRAFYTQKRASFLSSWQGKLYVGTFYMNDVTRAATSLSTMQCYDPYTGAALGGEITFPTNTTQGVEFVNHNNETYLLISSSYGRGNRSELISAKWDGGTGLSEYKRMSIPNMSEEIAFSGDSLIIGFESAARTYMTGGSQTSIRPVDRIVAIDYRSMLP